MSTDDVAETFHRPERDNALVGHQVSGEFVSLAIAVLLKGYDKTEAWIIEAPAKSPNTIYMYPFTFSYPGEAKFSCMEMTKVTKHATVRNQK